jgi:3-oxoacyl-[acyl-carrier-protein] synthase-3
MVEIGADGSGGPLVQTTYNPGGAPELHLDGVPLAQRAVRAMAQSVADLVRCRGKMVSDLTAVIAHGGNGRLPPLLARELGIPAGRVWSETPTTGNLGSASLPAAWAAHQPLPQSLVAWTAVGAGLTWGAALTGNG